MEKARKLFVHAISVLMACVLCVNMAMLPVNAERAYAEESQSNDLVEQITEDQNGALAIQTASATQTMYRLYNPNSGEHFYTASAGERDSVQASGWNYEGVAWTAPVSSDTPVYRLYSGTDHHYTTSAAERDMLVGVGWSDEGIGWYSDDAQGVPLYRQFNPNVDPSASYNNSGSHNYTTSKGENDHLVSLGWIAEDIGWYGVDTSKTNDDSGDAESSGEGGDGEGAFAYDDPEVSLPEKVDPEHKNLVNYDDEVKFASGVDWTVGENGSVSITQGSLPEDLSEGDVLILESSDNNSQSYAIVVGPDGASSSNIEGRQPSLDELYDEVDIEAIGGVEPEGFVPEDEVEIESVDVVDIEESQPTQTVELRPDNEATKESYASESMQLATQTLTPSSKTSKFTIKFGDISFSVEPKAVTKLKYDKSGIQVAYLALDMKEELKAEVKASDLFNGGKIEKKLGSMLFPTGVPGLSVETAVYFNLSADGKISFSLKAASTTGFSYKNGTWKLIAKSEADKASVEAKAEVKVGADITPSINLCGLTVVDASLSGDFKLGTSSKDVKTRSNGMVCSDFKLKFGTKAEVGKHDSLMKTMFHLSWEKELLEDILLKKWHMENGRFVNSCTWKEDGSTTENYDNSDDLILKEPELPLVQETIEQNFTLATSKSVVWVPLTSNTDCAGVEVTISDPDDGHFDAYLSYGIFTGTGDDAHCVAEKGISLYASYAIRKDNTTTLSLSDAGTYYLRITNACYVNPYYYDTDVTNVNTLQLKARVLNNDSNENNNDYANATQIKQGSGNMFRLVGNEDVDVFSFKTSCAGKATINVWGQNEHFDSKIGYTIFGFNEDGSMNSIGNLGVSSYASDAFKTAKTKTFDIPAAGTYYVKVANAYHWNPYYYDEGADNKTPLFISYDFVETD